LKRALFAILILVSAWSLSACGGSNENKQSGGEVDAKTVYQQNCASCHGNQLQGGMGPNLKHVGSHLSKEQILKQIKNGGGGMPGGLVSGKKAEAVATWLANHK
jgi:mono/diheme cytochrome c family protein